MRHAGAVKAGCVIAVAAVGTCGFALPSLAASRGAPVVTPPGITLQPLGRGQGYNMEALLTEVPRNQIAFTDAHGMTLYTYDKDSPGKSACVDKCAKAWPPALAPASARSFGDWSVFKRPDGTKQWQYKGKPLYTFVRDKDIGALFGASPKQRRFGGGRPELRPTQGTGLDQGRAGGGPGRAGAGQGRAGANQARAGGANQGRSPLADWHPALMFPDTDIKMPDGVAVGEVGDAGGLAFVDQSGMTIYEYEGRGGAKAVVALADQTQWKPLVAPELAHGIGDWTVINRSDGVQQWAYKGKPLFTFAGDLTAGDANGVGLSKDWNAALAVAFYMPPNVRFEQTLDRGRVLATASGMTLYRRDGVFLDTGGGQSLRHGVPIRPGIGRNVGISGCEGDCLKSWHPFLAPANAQPDGYWDIAVRPDGTHQWVYQGYALYTYSGDQKPGDMNGNDIFNMVLSNSPDQVNDVGTPMHGTAGLYWTIAYP